MEELSMDELRAQGKVIEHNDAPAGTVFYPGFGRACPDCKCFFSNSYDYGLHKRVCNKEARMGCLSICLPEKGWAYELFKELTPDLTVSVHGDGTLHIFSGETHAILKPDNENMRLVE